MSYGGFHKPKAVNFVANPMAAILGRVFLTECDFLGVHIPILWGWVGGICIPLSLIPEQGGLWYSTRGRLLREAAAARAASTGFTGAWRGTPPRVYAATGLRRHGFTGGALDKK